MKQQDTRLQNEFEYELPKNTMDEFNTLQSFSAQPTTLLETTLTDALGLSMHNAVTNQQQSQMTTAASVTNACARLLQTKAAGTPSSTKADSAARDVVVTPVDIGGEANVEPELEQEMPDGENKEKQSAFKKLLSKLGGRKS